MRTAMLALLALAATAASAFAGSAAASKLSACFAGFQPDAASKLQTGLRLKDDRSPKLSAAVIGREQDGLMYLSQLVGTDFGHVQVMDLAALKKLQNSHDGLLQTLQDTLATEPSTLFVLRGLHELQSAPDMALLDVVHDMLDDGVVYTPTGAAIDAKAAGVLLAVDSEGLSRSPLLQGLEDAEDTAALNKVVNGKGSSEDTTKALQAVLSVAGREVDGAKVFTPSSFVGRLRSVAVLAHLSPAQQSKLEAQRVSDPHCSHAALVAATKQVAAVQLSEQLEAATAALSAWWMDPHTQSILLPQVLTSLFVCIVLSFAFCEGRMPPRDSLHHPSNCYKALKVERQADDAEPVDLDVDGTGHWWGPAQARPKRSVAAERDAAPSSGKRASASPRRSRSNAHRRSTSAASGDRSPAS